MSDPDRRGAGQKEGGDRVVWLVGSRMYASCEAQVVLILELEVELHPPYTASTPPGRMVDAWPTFCGSLEDHPRDFQLAVIPPALPTLFGDRFPSIVRAQASERASVVCALVPPKT